jgi:hypothetical protein
LSSAAGSEIARWSRSYLIERPEAAAPQAIAVLPFTDRGNANYVVDKVPLTFRKADQRADWA